MPRPTHTDVEWEPLDLAPEVAAPILARMRAFHSAWERTPWMDRQRRIRVGVDCLRYMEAFFDAMRRVEPRPIAAAAGQAASLHDSRVVMRVVREAVRSYDGERVPRGAPIRPGDAVVTAFGGGPGHVLIGGPDPGTLWHALKGVGVCWTGTRLVGLQVLRAYRPKGIAAWI